MTDKHLARAKQLVFPTGVGIARRPLRLQVDYRRVLSTAHIIAEAAEAAGTMRVRILAVAIMLPHIDLSMATKPRVGGSACTKRLGQTLSKDLGEFISYTLLACRPLVSQLDSGSLMPFGLRNKPCAASYLTKDINAWAVLPIDVDLPLACAVMVVIYST